MRPLTQVDPGGEVYLRFCERKLAEYHVIMVRTSAPRLARTYFVSDGSTIYIESVALGQGQFRDSIRINTSGFDFLTLITLSTGPNFRIELWALKRDSNTLLYVPVLVDTWTPTKNPWKSPSAVPSGNLAVTRDISHGASVWDSTPQSLRRGAGSSPADIRVGPYGDNKFVNYSGVPTGAPTPASNMVMFAQDSLAGPATLRRLGGHADSSFPIADFVNRAKVIFPPGSSWSYPGSVAYPVAPNKVLAVVRPFISLLTHAVYAERFRVDVDPDTDAVTLTVEDALATNEVYSLQGGGTRIGERTFSTTGRFYSFTAGIGELEWAKYIMTDVTYSSFIRDYGNFLEPDVTRPYNNLFSGLAFTGAPLVPGAMQFNGVLLQNEVSAAGFPFFCNSWPTPIRIGDDQYWWINTQAIKSSETFEPGSGGYWYSSPHAYRYRKIVMKNGAVTLDQTDVRNYTSYLDLPQQDVFGSNPHPVDSWDSTAPVFIYVPTDGARIGGTDWFCGLRVEQVFTTFAPGPMKDLPYKTRPAVWKADLSEIHTYADFEVSVVPPTVNQLATQANVTLTSYFFGRYKGAHFFVFLKPGDGRPWGVGMDTPAEAPVQIMNFGPEPRQNPPSRSL